MQTLRLKTLNQNSNHRDRISVRTPANIDRVGCIFLLFSNNFSQHWPRFIHRTSRREGRRWCAWLARTARSRRNAWWTWHWGTARPSRSTRPSRRQRRQRFDALELSTPSLWLIDFSFLCPPTGDIGPPGLMGPPGLPGKLISTSQPNEKHQFPLFSRSTRLPRLERWQRRPRRLGKSFSCCPLTSHSTLYRTRINQNSRSFAFQKYRKMRRRQDEGMSDAPYSIIPEIVSSPHLALQSSD